MKLIFLTSALAFSRRLPDRLRTNDFSLGDGPFTYSDISPPRPLSANEPLLAASELKSPALTMFRRLDALRSLFLTGEHLGTGEHPRSELSTENWRGMAGGWGEGEGVWGVKMDLRIFGVWLDEVAAAV